MAEDEDPNIISTKERKKAESEKGGVEAKIDYTKYAVGGESKEVQASPQAKKVITQSRIKVSRNKSRKHP